MIIYGAPIRETEYEHGKKISETLNLVYLQQDKTIFQRGYYIKYNILLVYHTTTPKSLTPFKNYFLNYIPNLCFLLSNAYLRRYQTTNKSQ